MLQGPSPAWSPSRAARLTDLWPLLPSLNLWLTNNFSWVCLSSKTYIHSQGHLRSLPPTSCPKLISDLKSSQISLFWGTRWGSHTTLKVLVIFL